MNNPDFLPLKHTLRGPMNQQIQLSLLNTHQISFHYQERTTGTQFEGTISNQQLTCQKNNHSIQDVISLYQLLTKSAAPRLSKRGTKLFITLLHEDDGLITQEDVFVELAQSSKAYSQVQLQRAELSQIRELSHQLNKEFMEYKAQHALSLQKSQKVLLAQVQALKEQLQKYRAFLGCQLSQIYPHKHKQVIATANLIANKSQLNEIRWILLGSPLSARMHQKWLFQIDAISWMALGLADRSKLEYRRYEGLNGRSDHGCHVMDSTGWVHTDQGSLYNYQQMGFTFRQGDQLYLQINGFREEIKFVNQNSLEVFYLPFDLEQCQIKGLFVAIAVNKECYVTYHHLNSL